MRALLLVIALSTSASSVRAQPAYDCIDRLSDAEVQVRNQWLQRRFDASATRARLWWYGQIALWTGISVFQTVLSVTSDTVDERFPNVVGTVGAWLTWAQLLIVPHTPAYAPQRFRRAPSSTPQERRARLRYGLELLEKGADRQALGGGPLAHVVPFLWSGFWGSYISARFKDAWTSVRMVGGGLLVSEFRILSMPQQAVADWEMARGMNCGADYVTGQDSEPSQQGIIHDAPVVDEDDGPQTTITPTLGGLHLQVQF